MRVLNFGSLNLDYVYSVDHNVNSKETLASTSRKIFCGGKGLNQSIALKKAGVDVYHAGMIGKEGQILLDELNHYHVNTDFVRIIDEPTGHAIIQVDKYGQNSILLYGGANQCIDEKYIDEVLLHFGEGDFIVLQNEISHLDYIIEQAYLKKMIIVLNPSPLDSKLKSYDLSKVSYFFINEVEGEQLSGFKDPKDILNKLKTLYPQSIFILTLGELGSIYYKDEMIEQSAYQTTVVDTTAAGDTFSGYFIAGLVNQMNIQDILDLASQASSITVSREGASASIPLKEELGL